MPKATASVPAFDPKNPGIYFDPNDPASQSVTNQSDKDSVDLNLMFKRYEKTGLIPDLLLGTNRKPFFGDFTSVPNFHELQITLAKTQQAFDALPASTRTKFNNDPQQIIDFLADPKNDQESVDLGLRTLKDIPAPKEPEKAPEPAKATGQPA